MIEMSFFLYPYGTTGRIISHWGVILSISLHLNWAYVGKGPIRYF